MITALIIVVVIAVFCLGPLCTLGAIRCRKLSHHPTHDKK